jgi:SAM-dependent methyltransferase
METSLEIQTRLAKAENYNTWIYENIAPFLGNRILEVGCAIGNLTRFFLDREWVTSLDISEEYCSYMRRKFRDCKNLEVICCDGASREMLNLRPRNFDTVVCLNVLEHIEADQIALRNMFEVLIPGGRLVLLVPAFQALYGSMDAADHHFRRYEKKELCNKLQQAGFQIQKIFYMNALGILGWYINGKILKRRIIPEKQLISYNKIIPIIKKIERIFPPPFGQSLIAIAEKFQ